MGNSLARSDEAAWSDLEQAFFASAPPDTPEPPLHAEPFDDLLPPAPTAGGVRPAWARFVSVAADIRRRGALALAGAQRGRRRMTVVAASVTLVLALSVGVVASRSGAQAIAALSPTEAPATAPGADGAETRAPGSSPSGRVDPRSSSEPRARHHKASKRPPRHRRRPTGSSASSSRTAIASRHTGPARSR